MAFLVLTTTSSVTPAATPAYSPVAGSYASTQTVTISCSTPSPSIYYTTDGSSPTYPITGTTQQYSTPISVSTSETVKAIAVAAGYSQSLVGSATYTIGVSMSGYKFAYGHMYMSVGNQSNTPSSGAQGWPTEIANWLALSQGTVGYEPTFNWSTLENLFVTTNLALSQVADGGPIGATGAALQTAINTQYPGFSADVAGSFYCLMASAAAANLGFLPYYSLTILQIFGGANSYDLSDVEANWTTYDRVNVPKYVINCNGSLTVPASYGSASTQTYSVAPLSSTQLYYGFGFANNATSSNFNLILPALQNPGVVQIVVQLWQALAQWTFPGGSSWVSGTTYSVGTPVTYTDGNSYLRKVAGAGSTAPPSDTTNWMLNAWYGQTVDQNPQFVSLRCLDEISWYQTSSNNISGITINPPTQGSSPYAATAANLLAGCFTKAQAVKAAFPRTQTQPVCPSYGWNATTNSSSPPSIMAAFANDEFSPDLTPHGLSSITGLAYGGADTYGSDYIVTAGGVGANQTKLGLLGEQNPATTSFSPNPTFWQRGKMPMFNTVEPLDYQQGLLSGVTKETTQCVKNIFSAGATLGGSLYFWCAAGEDFNYSDWNNWISPAINGPATSWTDTSLTDSQANWPASGSIFMVGWTVQITSGTLAGSTSIVSSNNGTTINFPAITGLGAYGTAPSFVLYNAMLPTSLMFGVPVAAMATSPTTVTVTWTNATGVGSGLSYSVYRNGSALSGGTGITNGVYHDTGLTAGDTYVYAIAMANPNGTGVVGPGTSVTTP